MLEDHADGFSRFAKLGVGQRHHIKAVHDDGAAGRALQQIDAADQSGLARAGQPDDAENLALGDGKADVLQCSNGPVRPRVCFFDMGKGNHGKVS